ncbi:TPA: hypothetical protein ACHGKV_001084 [Escherichia coli]
MTITKQRVEKIIYRHEMGLNSDVTAEEVYDLAVLALNLSNIANLKRYELDTGGCDPFSPNCCADMSEDPDGEFVMLEDVVRLVQFDTTAQQFESPAKEATSDQD